MSFTEVHLYPQLFTFEDQYQARRILFEENIRHWKRALNPHPRFEDDGYPPDTDKVIYNVSYSPYAQCDGCGYKKPRLQKCPYCGGT